MRQVGVLGIHTVCYLERSGELILDLSVERVQVTVALNEFQRNNLEQFFGTFVLGNKAFVFFIIVLPFVKFS